MADISKGDQNNKVKELQRALIRIGYPLDRWGADGQVGGETLSAIAEFCDDKGLEETDLDSGIVRGWIVDAIMAEAIASTTSVHPLIEDVRHDEYTKWRRRNKIKNIDTICLHQMAVKDSDDKGWHRWRRLAIHWVVTCGDWSPTQVQVVWAAMGDSHQSTDMDGCHHVQCGGAWLCGRCPRTPSSSATTAQGRPRPEYLAILNSSLRQV